MDQHAAEAILVVDGSGTYLQSREPSTTTTEAKPAEFRVHGGLGVLRLRNVLNGGVDQLASVCDIRQGDVFVDCTAGQLQDSIVAAAVVGPNGRVIAFEASPLLYAVTSGRPVTTGDLAVDQLLNDRIEVRLGEAATLLAAMPDASVDVVYFDPMWQKPEKASASFEVLRRLAHQARLSREAVEEARRVARRIVVVMDQAHGGGELERLGLNIVNCGQRKRYGVATPLALSTIVQ